jgi:hypothetical protein
MFDENFCYEDRYPKEPPSCLYEEDDWKVIVAASIRALTIGLLTEETEGKND